MPDQPTREQFWRYLAVSAIIIASGLLHRNTDWGWPLPLSILVAGIVVINWWFEKPKKKSTSSPTIPPVTRR